VTEKRQLRLTELFPYFKRGMLLVSKVRLGRSVPAINDEAAS
jgi:hypothetical protein